MEIINECSAPQSFADTIYEAAGKSKQLLNNEFGLNGIPVSDIYITDEKKPAEIIVPDEYKSGNFIKRLEKILAKIKHMIYCYDIQPCYNLINEMYVYINMMLDIANRTEIEMTEKQRIKTKDRLIEQIRIALENRYGDFETDIKLNEILQDMTEAERIFPMIYLPSNSLGCFEQKNNRIYICYKTISDNINNTNNMDEKKAAGQYGSYIFAHEFFHAFHYLNLTGNTADNCIPYQEYVHGCTVKESLAEYFAYAYAQKYAVPAILKKAEIYRIPAWGYNGTEIFKNVRPFPDGKNTLFSDVYYLSLTDMDDAYRLLCDDIKQIRISSNNNFYH